MNFKNPQESNEYSEVNTTKVVNKQMISLCTNKLFELVNCKNRREVKSEIKSYFKIVQTLRLIDTGTKKTVLLWVSEEKIKLRYESNFPRINRPRYMFHCPKENVLEYSTPHSR